MTSKYRLSFTSGGLFLRESLDLLNLHKQLCNWEDVRTEAVAANTLQLRTTRSSHRVSREIIARLKTLSDNDLRALDEGSHEDQRLILWLAVCRLYSFIAEFAVEVLHERFITLKSDVTLEDFDIFYNRKAEWHTELDTISPLTRKKLRQVLFRMMREAGLINASHMIIPCMLSPRLQDALTTSGKSDFDLFPAHLSDVHRRVYR